MQASLPCDASSNKTTHIKIAFAGYRHLSECQGSDYIIQYQARLPKLRAQL